MDILFHPDRSLFQVTGKEQKIPEIILRIIDISVCDVFMNRFSMMPPAIRFSISDFTWKSALSTRSFTMALELVFSNKGTEMLPGLLTELLRN